MEEQYNSDLSAAEPEALSAQEPGEEIIRFRLTEEQLYSALRARGIFRTQGVRAVIQTVLLAVLGIGFFISYFGLHDGSGLFLGIVSFAVIAMIWLVPWLGLRARARDSVPKKEVPVSLSAESLTIGEGEGQWEFPLDGSGFFWQTEELYLLETSFGRMTVIPKSALSPAQAERWIPQISGKTVAAKPKRRRRG